MTSCVATNDEHAAFRQELRAIRGHLTVAVASAPFGDAPDAIAPPFSAGQLSGWTQRLEPRPEPLVRQQLVRARRRRRSQ